MKDQFPGYYQRSEEERETLWQDGLFVLDANVLLNPYRYSEETRKELFRILRGVQERLWIPHQAAEEFHRNRLEVIRGQKGAYAEVRKSLSAAQKQIEDKVNAVDMALGRVTKSLLKKVKEAFDTLLAEARQLESDSGAKSVPESYSPNRDDIWQEVIDIMEGNVSERLSDERMEELRREGPRRYASEVPPGYEDANKPGERKYGDLILWFQIIEKALEAQKPILLVTDDRKEDWWIRSGGTAVEPHPDLANEMNREVGVLFHMMLPLDFLKWAGPKLNQEISQAAAEEIEELRSLEEPSEALGVSEGSWRFTEDDVSAVDHIRTRDYLLRKAELLDQPNMVTGRERLQDFNLEERLRRFESIQDYDLEERLRRFERLKDYDLEERLKRFERLKDFDLEERLRRLERLNDSLEQGPEA